MSHISKSIGDTCAENGSSGRDPTPDLASTAGLDHTSHIKRLDQGLMVFSQLSKNEQSYLLDLANWHRSIRIDVIPKPNPLSDAYALWNNPEARRIAQCRSSPRVVCYLLAQIYRPVRYIERRRCENAREKFFFNLARAARGDSHGLLGAIFYLNLVGTEIGGIPVVGEIEEVWSRALDPVHMEPADRLAALRAVSELKQQLASTDWNASMRSSSDALLRVSCWEDLLELARMDLNAAHDVIRRDWKSEFNNGVFHYLKLAHKPDLSYELAVLFRYRFDLFAFAMLQSSISETVNKLLRKTDFERDQIAAINSDADSKCLLLANWLLENPAIDSDAQLSAARCLLKNGNPEQLYWPQLLAYSLDLYLHINREHKKVAVAFVASVAFYAEVGSATYSEALTRFSESARSACEGNVDPIQRVKAVRRIIDAVSILEDKVLSGRNRYVAPNIDHQLMHIARQALRTVTREFIDGDKNAVLKNLSTLTCAVDVEGLFREALSVFTAAFEVRLTQFPKDAGCALLPIIHHAGSSYLPDSSYHKQLCTETFERLFSRLEVVSPEDADEVRPHITWLKGYIA